MTLSAVSACTGEAGKPLSEAAFPGGRIFLAISDSRFTSGCGEAGVPDVGFPLLLTSIKLPTCSATFGKLLFFFFSSGSVSSPGRRRKVRGGGRVRIYVCHSLLLNEASEAN